MGITTTKDNDYMIHTTQELSTGGILTRTFNFASENLTTLYERMYRYGEAVGMTSQMTVQNFSELDSQAEVELMRRELENQGGHPPASAQSTAKTRITPVAASPKN